MKRPSGISFLAVLYILGAILVLGMQIALGGKTIQSLTTMGSTGIYAFIMIAILSVLQLVAGIGMWTGKKWGWWLGALYLFLAVARAIDSLIAIPFVMKQFGPPEPGLAIYSIKFIGRAILYSFIIRYFFTEKVEAYFDVTAIPARNRFVRLVSITVVIMLISSIAAWIMG